MKYVIVGAGVAGLSAIEAIRSVDKSGEILMISDDPHGFYSRPGLAYFLTGELKDRALFPRTKEDYQKLNFNFVNARVTRILRSDRALLVDGKSRLTYDKLLLAVGARAQSLEVPGADLFGVVKLDHLADAKNIIKQACRGNTVVVVGGGITALELAEGLHARGMHVHYLLRGDRYWGNVLDKRESQVVEARLKEEGIQLHYKAEIEGILGRKGYVAAVKLRDGNMIKCDMVAYAVGIAPSLDLVQETNLAKDRGILVNEHLQTTDPDIYAAGDVAQVFDPLSGKSVIDSLWNPARDQGQVAGLNMAGRKTVYLKSAPFNVTRLAGLTTTIIGVVGRGRDEDMIGIARGDSETWRELPEAIVAQSGFEVNHLRLMVGDRNLVGAVVMGDQTLSWPLQKIIDGKADISAIRDQLMEPGAPLADLIAQFWMKWREQVAL